MAVTQEDKMNNQENQTFELAVPAPVLPPSDVERRAVAEVHSSLDKHLAEVLARHAPRSSGPDATEEQ
jgi:hypothetical protein